MKIGIYNRYWNTCGGGENYTGSVAEILSKSHEVELISVEPVDWNRIESRLRLDLSRCSTTQWPNDPCSKLSPLSAQYDLFINSTYSSSILPQSKLSALICYFPHKIDDFSIVRSKIVEKAKEFIKFLRGKNIPSLRVRPLNGAFAVEPDGRSWIGRSSTLEINGLHSNSIIIPLWPDTYNGIKSINLTNGKNLQWKTQESKLLIDCELHPTQITTISIKCIPIVPKHSNLSDDSRELGACIDTRVVSWMDSKIEDSIQKKQEDVRASLSKYDRIISISEFTSEWINRRWKLPSVELQPPIDTTTFNLNQKVFKEKIILSVGRFFAGGHNKKHYEIASAFIKMRREGHISSKWRLVLVGARHFEHKKHIDYFKRLESLCEGHPIDIKPDLPFAELLQHYQKASIYWHAAGWGEKIEKCPERFEHFGMTTCEAMACCCVPVVFDAAGQREIVATEQLGFRYTNFSTLSRQMKYLTTADPCELLKIGKEARESINRYSRINFDGRVKVALGEIAY